VFCISTKPSHNTNKGRSKLLEDQQQQNYFKMIKILFIICSLSLFSCKSNSQKDKEPKNKQKQDSTSEIKNRLLARCKQLNIDYLKTSLGKAQIRIWIQFPFCDSGRFINLKKENGHWRGELYQYRFDLDNDNPGQSVLISKNKVNGTPRSGWSAFLNKIEKLGIYTLNDNNRIHNYGLCNDGDMIVVEIVKDNRYFEYIYPCWIAIEDQSQINKIKGILQLVQVEFGFKVFPLEIQLSDLKKLIK
jgi:hypothetical protein